MKTEIESRVKKHLIRQSHERQFNGEDWQKVAVDLSGYIPNCTEGEFNELSHSPDPGCDCGFCATADWKD